MITEPKSTEPLAERRFYFLLGALTLFLASVPYLWGYLITPANQIYTGLSYNIDDTCVYLAWMREAELGHFFFRNQFSIEPQRGVLFNLFFWLLGTIVRFTHLPAVAVYHGARVVFGTLLLGAVAGLLRETLSCRRARRTAFALVCVSSGFGWMWGGYSLTRQLLHQSVDVWQPEAITFLSLYFTPLFAAALFAMVTFFRAMLRAERSGRLRDLWPAALAGALLGNFHSYDVIHLFVVWIGFRLLTDALARRISLPGWGRLILVGAATLPTTAYQYWAIRVEPTFYERAFLSATWSPKPLWFLLGYGLVALLSIGALVLLAPRLREGPIPGGGITVVFPDTAAIRFLFTWAILGMAVAYVPTAFQRKLLMGEHLPLCALAGAALAVLTRRMRGALPHLLTAGVVLCMIPTNVWFLVRDMNRLVVNQGSTPHRPRLDQGEWDALQWLRRNTSPSEVVLAGMDAATFYPTLSVYVPAFAGNVVYDGHWAETSHFGDKLRRTRHFFRAATDDRDRQAFLRENNIRYILYMNSLSGGPLKAGKNGYVYDPVSWPQNLPPYLKPVYTSREVTIYRADL